MKTGRHTSVLMFTVALTVTGCKNAGPPSAIPQQVQLGKVLRLVDDEGERHSVSLTAARQADLSFKSAGMVTGIRQVFGSDGKMHDLTMGDRVIAGTELARVESSDYEQKVSEANASVDQARGSLASAMASQHLAQANFTRASNLYRLSSLTRKDMDSAQQQRDTADASVQQAEANVVSATAQAAEATSALRNCILRTPFTGIVINRQVEVGSFAGNSNVAVTVADIHELKADFTISDTALPLFRRGEPMSIDMPVPPGSFSGVVTAISGAADPQSRVFTIEVTIPNSSGVLKPGMIGSLRTNGTRPHGPTLQIPLGALVRGGTDKGGLAVYVVRAVGASDRVHAIPVTVGRILGDELEIVGGLTEGEQIVTVGAQNLHENDEVRVSP